MTEDQPKSGEEFEVLVTWIYQCLHEKAIITPNDKIRDIDSNRLRQVDISIRLKDGPTSFLGIVEIRDRSRPIGENYIEEISAKRVSVGADAAFLVSSSGFYETAIKKAKALNIRLFTYSEAVSSNWMQCLQLKEITQFIERMDNVVISFLELGTNKIIDPHQSLLEAMKENVNSLILTTSSGEPKFSIINIGNMAVNQHRERMFGGLAGGARFRKQFFITLQTPTNEPPIYFRDSTDVQRQLECFSLTADFWIETRKSPVHLSKYSNAGNGEAIAEVASASIEAWGSEHKLQLIAKFFGEKGSQVLMRLQKQDSNNDKLD